MLRSAYRFLRAVQIKFSGLGLGRVPFVSTVFRRVLSAVKPRKILEIRAPGGKMFVDPSDTGLAPDLMMSGVYEPDVTAAVEKMIPEKGVVVNVGANIGYYALIAAKKVGPDGRVFALEPEPRNFALLTKNVQLNRCSNVVIEQAAAADSLGEANLYLDSENHGNPSLSSKNVSAFSCVTVRADTLDNYVRRWGITKIDLLQMDAQGAEGRILEGAKGAALKLTDRLVMEFWPKGLENSDSDPLAVLELLSRAGYAISVIEDVTNREIEDFESLIDACRMRKNGNGAVNLLAVRKSGAATF